LSSITLASLLAFPNTLDSLFLLLLLLKGGGWVGACCMSFPKELHSFHHDVRGKTLDSLSPLTNLPPPHSPFLVCYSSTQQATQPKHPHSFFFTLPIAENQAPLLVVLLHKKLAAAELDLLPTSPTQLLLCFSLLFFPFSFSHTLTSPSLLLKGEGQGMK
jgi:hypothetical protein